MGILWAFIQPLITVVIFWFVFQIGFKSKPVDNFPFILWLVCGLFPWFFFNDALNSATNSIVNNSFLVKKVVFRIELLPIIQITSSLIISLFFNALLFFMFAVYGYEQTIYNVQMIYYLFATICLSWGLSLITSSLMVFLKDVGQIVNMFLQFGFWGTPIFWSLKMIPEEFHFIFYWNPMYYVVEGYRNSFIYNKWFWDLGAINFIFWGETIIVMLIGITLFYKLKPHFADVL